jgi:hypothetical protein
MAPSELTRVVKIPNKNIPNTGPLKNPMIATATSISEPMWAEYTPTAAMVTATPQTNVTQRAPLKLIEPVLAPVEFNRAMKSMHVAVLKEFKPDENTDIVAANSPAKTNPAIPDGITCRTKCGRTMFASPVRSTSSLSDASNAVFSGAW